MVLIKIAIVAVAIAATLGFAKQQMWFERAGLLSQCEKVATPYGARGGGQWWSCKEGALNGLPNLAADHCDSRGVRGNTELWLCPYSVDKPTF
ncbi:MAG: hypothetical protein OEW31_07655 [Thermoleophilia bacterium]|nr:hypothetical protein [Thermoleophilia bacterium]MDH4346193.1 hypothetical protein [Thermoleophilia bacterium]MDH5333560.1 hypothetical protein [Thermoleophilia bacterium]